MLQRYSNKELSYYPHMSADESIIWGRFLASKGQQYVRFDYDLRVGTGIEPVHDIPDKFKNDYIDLTRKRIDAVGYNGSVATIFEVKNRATFNVFGQIIGYRSLFLKSFPQYSIKELVVVCASIPLEDLEIVSSQGIVVLQYPD